MKKKYEVLCISTFSKYLGTFEAESEEDAIEQAYKSNEYQSIGGLCYQCSDTFGDGDGGEIVADVLEDK